jgi:hypothetical protein
MSCTCGLVGDLREEGCDLALASGQVAGAGELGEGSGGPDERRVGIEPLGRARGVVLVQENRAVELLAHERLHGAALPGAPVPPRLHHAAAGSDRECNHEQKCIGICHYRPSGKRTGQR